MLFRSIVTLGAVIDSPFKGLDRIDFIRQGRECLLDVFHGCWIGVILELEENSMLEFFLDLSLRWVPSVIDDKDIFHVGFKSICEFARMSGMWQIRITSCLILEGRQESVSESIIEFFRTVICPPLKIND